METVSKKKRGRPSIYYKQYGDDPTMRSMIDGMITEIESERSKTNFIYYLEGMTILQHHLGEQGFADTFFTPVKRKAKWTCIVEQIGRMSLQNHYNEQSCNQIADTAIKLLKDGYTVRAVERWIRQGRNTNEW